MKNKFVFLVIGSCTLLILPIVWLFYYVSPLRTLTQLAFSKNISGKIYDCATGAPVENAQVSIAGVGWGFRHNLLVWDQVYSKSAESDLQGNYTIEYATGTEMAVSKDGYLPAYYYSEPDKNVDIGLLSNGNVQDKNERTYQCKLESECDKEVVKDGVIIGWDSCSNPNSKP